MNDKSGFKEIEIPKDKTLNWNTIPHSPSDQWEAINDLTQIEDYTIQINVVHLNQTQGTPFTVNPLQALLNNDSFTTFGQQMLDGDANLQNFNLSEIQKEFFYELKQHPTITASPLNNIISIEEMTSGFKKWREDTSTSPSL